MTNFSRTTMMLLFLFATSIYSCADHDATAPNPQVDSFLWDTLPDLAPYNGEDFQSGLGAAFSGTHNGAIIIAGGNNFKGQVFWEGGQKHWYDQIMVLNLGTKEWQQQAKRLPQKWSYGLSVSTKEGLLLIGGRDETSISDKVHRIRWDEKTEEVTLDTFPDLPVPLFLMSGALVGNRVYVAGGLDSLGGKPKHHFYSLEISHKGLLEGWKTETPWPGKPRLLPVAAAQSNGLTDCFYLLSGQFPGKKTTNEYLTDAYEYNPTTSKWRQIADIQPDKLMKQATFAAPGISVGANHIAVFGGVTGHFNIQLEKLNLDLAATKDTDKIAKLKNQQATILNNHPGFSKSILLYHTITNTWTSGGLMPFPSLITSNVFHIDDKMVIANGEVKPGVRSSRIYQIGLKDQEAQMKGLDYILLASYALILIFMGWYFARRQKNTEDYFKGGGRIPWWAAALSLFGTSLSAITFMAVPAKTFATNWAYLILSLSIILIPPIVSRIFIPSFRKYNITSAFEYLQIRFNKPVQLLGAISFLLFQLGRVGIILYLPALALHVVLGLNLFACIAFVGLISLLYTLLGGIEAVIWTDVFQVIILIGGALFCLLLITMKVEGGLGELIQIGMDQQKFEIFNMAFDLKQPTFWVVLLGGFFSYLITFGTDQTMVQRYLSTSNIADAQKSIWTNALIALPSILLFFFIGTALYGYYQQHPSTLPVGIATDAVFPSFIVKELPAGMAGLLISAIFAAAMSSVSSSINSAATVYSIDCHAQFTTKPVSLAQARLASLLFGLLGICFAMLLASSDVKSIWDEFIKIIGLLTGGLGGIFLLGMISKRANGMGALFGLLASAVIQYWVSSHQLVHVLLYAVTGFVSAFVLGYLLSFLFRNEVKTHATD